MGERKLNDKQQAFVAWYVKLLNGTRAAERAGYEGDSATLAVKGSNLLRNAKVRAEIDKLLEESIPTPKEILGRIGSQATMDVTPYTRGDGTLDVQALGDAGLGHLVAGTKPGREGPEITLVHPQTAQKMLARYHRLLGADVQVDASTMIVADEAALAGLVEQIAAANQADSVPDDTTTDGSKDN